jgi:hypothetical protein
MPLVVLNKVQLVQDADVQSEPHMTIPNQPADQHNCCCVPGIKKACSKA